MAESKPRFRSTRTNKSNISTNPQCSCPSCDSMQCFAKRQVDAACSCLKCNNSKSCLYFPQNNNQDNNVESTNQMKIPMEGEDITVKEQVKREITYELLEVTKTTSVAKSLKNTMFSDNKNFEDTTNNSNVAETLSGPINDESVCMSCKERNASAAKLSAQVMNVPYQYMQDDISNKKSETSSYKISAYEVLKRIREAYKACSCKVCECLVGKSTVPKNQMCKCEPCECKDCASFLAKFQYTDRHGKQVPDGCPCVRCTRSQCKALNKKSDEPQYCDCPPGNRLQYSTSFENSCNCEPCQCLECKAISFGVPRSIIVAPVEQQHQSNYCQCTPCECIECAGHGIPSSFMRETATNVNRHPRCNCEICINEACIPDGSESCKCQRRSKIMTKPVEKDVRNYDIHAMVTSERNNIRIAKDKPVKNSMIALYATVPNVYKNFGYQKDCSCNLCECVVCNCKENAVDSIKSSQLFHDRCKDQNLTNLISGACKCSPCECEVCSKKKEVFNITPNCCKCDVCRCLECTDLAKVNSIKINPYVNPSEKQAIKETCQSIKDPCRCGPCECVECNKKISCAGDECSCVVCSCEHCNHESKESIYPIKKAQILTPSTFRYEILKEANIPKLSKISIKDNCGNATATKLHDSGKTMSQRDIFTYNKYPHNYRFIEKMEYILPPGKKTVLHPKSDNGDFKSQSPNRNNTAIYGAQGESSNMYRQNCYNYLQSTSKISAGSLSVNIASSSEQGTDSPVLVEGDLKDHSCDSGCCSLDYYTIVPDKKYKEEYNEQNQSSQNEKFHNNEETNNTVPKLSESNYMNTFYENSCQHHHSFESENKIYFTTKTKRNKSSITHPEINNRNITSNKRTYDQQYWIKNVDVSLKLHDSNRYKYEQRQSEENISKNSLTNNASSKSTPLESDISLPISRNIGYYALNSRGKEVEDMFNNEAYYEGVQKTLLRARAFSLQLMQILDKYERANNEFQSTAQKLKLSHASLLNKNKKDDADNDLNNSSLTPQISLQGSRPQNHVYFKLIHQETSTDDCNKFHMKAMKDRCTQVDNLLVNPKLLYYQNTCLLDTEKLKRLEEFYNMFRKKESKNALNGFITPPDRKLRGIKKSNKNGPRILKQLIILSKGSRSETNYVLKKHKSTQTQSHVLKNEEQIATNISTATNYLTEELEETDARYLDLLIPILKKNFYLAAKPVTKSKEMCKSPSLQRELKEAVKSITKQNKSSSNGYFPHKNVALENLQMEVRKLLDMPILQQSQKCKHSDMIEPPIHLQTQAQINVLQPMASACCQTNQDTDLVGDLQSKPIRCESSKSCCEDLKVSFQSLRRVSDHTVIVKWTAPRVTTVVTGYELLVDGRAVQKILSPSRCVAVVTCLPHCDSILLTIRTITLLTPSGHYPSSTIVYHPRVRRE